MYVKLNLVAPSSVLEAHYEPTDCPTALPEDRVLGSGEYMTYISGGGGALRRAFSAESTGVP